MITRTQQNWTPGKPIKVGFLSLIVKAAIPTPGDYLPDAYVLSNVAGTQLYKFVPHNGLEKISAAEARDLVDAGIRHTVAVAQEVIERAAMRQFGE